MPDEIHDGDCDIFFFFLKYFIVGDAGTSTVFKTYQISPSFIFSNKAEVIVISHG